MIVEFLKILNFSTSIPPIGAGSSGEQLAATASVLLFERRNFCSTSQSPAGIQNPDITPTQACCPSSSPNTRSLPTSSHPWKGAKSTFLPIPWPPIATSRSKRGLPAYTRTSSYEKLSHSKLNVSTPVSARPVPREARARAEQVKGPGFHSINPTSPLRGDVREYLCHLLPIEEQSSTSCLSQNQFVRVTGQIPSQRRRAGRGLSTQTESER